MLQILKKLKKTLRLSFASLLILSLGSCAKVTIPNIDVCSDAGSLGAFCIKSISGEERDVPKESWDKERFGMLCMNSQAFADIKTAILQLCNDNKRCVLEVEKKANEIDERLKKVASKGSSPKTRVPKPPAQPNG